MAFSSLSVLQFGAQAAAAVAVLAADDLPIPLLE
jgi:hypothetical protein